jgi:hypothetical protein
MESQSNKPEPQGIAGLTENEILRANLQTPSTALPGDTVMECRAAALEARIAILEGWARAYANPLLFRALGMGEIMEVNKKNPYDPPKGRDIPDLTKREI